MGSFTRNTARIDQAATGERPRYRCLHRRQNLVLLLNHVETGASFPRLPRPTLSSLPITGRSPQHPAPQEATTHISGSEDRSTAGTDADIEARSSYRAATTAILPSPISDYSSPRCFLTRRRGRGGYRAGGREPHGDTPVPARRVGLRGRRNGPANQSTDLRPYHPPTVWSDHPTPK